MAPTASPAKKKTSKEPSKATGEELPPFVLEVTPTVVVAGAIASRDFMPVHHDRNFAIEQGAPNIFMNILTTNGYVSRYITDWAGPEAMVHSIAIRLGAPAVPGHPLSFSGRVISESASAGERTVEVAVRAANDLGDHATGTVVFSLP
ncbi:MAG: acyl dehydratase [Acidimicrobiia bacterium]|nr:acyl dehydratase [Acidimicrobiia bacterium]